MATAVSGFREDSLRVGAQRPAAPWVDLFAPPRTRPPRSRPGRDSSISSLLASRAAGSDSDAVTVLYRRHVQAVRAMAHRRARPMEVDDLVAETFERAIKSLHTFKHDSPSGIRPWLLGICGNAAAEQRRRASRHFTQRAQQALSRYVAVPRRDRDFTEQSDTTQVVRSALRRLHPRHQEALRLRYFCDLEPAEIARTLGISPQATWSLLSRSRRALRDQLRQLDADVESSLMRSL